MKKAERAVLVGVVVAVAVALRWGFVATAHLAKPLRADAGQYAQYAKNLCEHGVYALATGSEPAPDSFRSPGYPAFLALCRLVAGEQGWMTLVLVLQTMLGAATVWLVYRLARRFLAFAPSLTAAALTAVSPHLVVAPIYVLTECVTTFVVTAGVLLFATMQQRRRGRLLAAAVVVGGAVLCNETLVFVPLVLAWTLLRRSGWRPAATFLVVALLPFAGWTLRNQLQTLAHSGGERVTASISHGSYPGMVFRDPRLVGFPYHEDPEQPAFGASWHGLADVMARRVAAEPWRYLSWYVFEKPLWLWRWDLVQGIDVLVYEVGNSPYERQPVMAASHRLMKWLHLPLMLLAASAAIGAALRRRVAVVPKTLGRLAVFATLAYLPVIPDPRYLQPFRPLLFVLAAAAIVVASGVVQRALVCRRLASAAPSNGPSQPAVAPSAQRLAPPSS